MKKYIVAILFSVFSVQAEEVPAYLKDSVITVTLKDGKTYKFNGNEYKVVKRGSKAKLVPEVRPVVVQAPAPKRNRITVHGGVGFDGLNTQLASNSVTIKQDKEPVFGLSFSRNFYKDYSVSATALTNQTYLLGVGQDF